MNEKLKDFPVKDLLEAAIEKSKDVAIVVDGQRIFKGSFVLLLGTIALLNGEILDAFKTEQVKAHANKKLVVPVPNMLGNLQKM